MKRLVRVYVSQCACPCGVCRPSSAAHLCLRSPICIAVVWPAMFIVLKKCVCITKGPAAFFPREMQTALRPLVVFGKRSRVNRAGGPWFSAGPSSYSANKPCKPSFGLHRPLVVISWPLCFRAVQTKGSRGKHKCRRRPGAMAASMTAVGMATAASAHRTAAAGLGVQVDRPLRRRAAHFLASSVRAPTRCMRGGTLRFRGAKEAFFCSSFSL